MNFFLFSSFTNRSLSALPPLISLFEGDAPPSLLFVSFFKHRAKPTAAPPSLPFGGGFLHFWCDVPSPIELV